MFNFSTYVLAVGLLWHQSKWEGQTPKVEHLPMSSREEMLSTALVEQLHVLDCRGLCLS